MSDERNEQETFHPIHELSETPFGSGGTQNEAFATPEPEPEPKDQPAAAEEAPKEAEEEMSMEAAMAGMGSGGVDYSGTFKSLTVGQVVDGVVVHIDREGVLVDVGTKSEGIVKLNELTRDPNVSPEDVVAVGDKIKVYVVETESHEGGPVLSKKRADFENAWDRVEHSLATGAVIKAMVTDRVKGGLVVDLGIRGFVPASHVGSGKLKNLDKFVGQSMPFKVIEVDRSAGKWSFPTGWPPKRSTASSNRRRWLHWSRARFAKAQCAGSRITVRLWTGGGRWTAAHQRDELDQDQPPEGVRLGRPEGSVMVLKLDLEHGRVSLGLRQILPDPWEDVKRSTASAKSSRARSAGWSRSERSFRLKAESRG